MAPKKNAAARDPAPQAVTTPHHPIPTTETTSTSTTTTPPASKTSDNLSCDKVIQNIFRHYVDKTPKRTKLLDVFLFFLVVVGALQFVYCVLAGNYPFNAFLSGFGATVGQFVLTISLRIQTTESNKSQFPKVSHER